MSLSTQLSVDSESTWHDEDIEVDSEDRILSQVTIEILNAVNNLKGEERNGPYLRDLEKTQTSIEDHVKEHASVVIYPSQQFFIVVELNERTRYGVKFFDENLIFCPLQDEPSSIQHSTRETQLHPGGKSGPFYNPDDSRMKLQEGYYQNPSITTEQTILSDSVNLERKGSFDSNNPSNLSYPKQSINTSLIEDYSQPNYLQPSYLSQLYTEQIDSFDSSFVQQDGEFNEFEFFHELSCTHTDTRIVH